MIVMIGETLMDLKEGCAYPGGSTLNTAIATARLGSEVFYFGKISGDKYGKQIIEYFENNNVSIESNLCNAKEKTIIANATVSGGKVSYTFDWENSATYSLTRVDLDNYFFKNKDVCCVEIGSISLMLDPLGQIIEDFVLSLDSKIKVVIDPNVRNGFGVNLETYKNRLLRLVKRCHLIKLSDEDLLLLFPDKAQEESIQQFFDLGLKNLIITSGKKGSDWYINKNTYYHQSSINAEIVDTIGCGDTFTGAVINALEGIGYFNPSEENMELAPQVIKEILQYATKAATENMKKSGCNPPTGKELKDIL
jgi:fructokinase